MKLFEVWLATNSNNPEVPSAWGALTSLKMSPAIAYELLTFGKELSKEVGIATEQKNKILYEVTGVEPGMPVTLERSDPKFNTFAEQFNEFLQLDSKLAECQIPFKKIVEELGKAETNTIDSVSLALLEPLFVAEKKE